MSDDTPDPDDEFVRAEKNRAGGMRALTPSTTCNCVVFLRHYHKSGDWFLGKKSCLTHNNHNRLDPTHKRVRREEISVVESDFAQIIFDQGGTVDCVTRVMNELRKNNGIIGIVQKRTVKHLLQKTRLDIDFIMGVTRDWTIARKTIKRLQMMNVSYIALVMDSNDDLLVYKGKGRPSREESEMIKTDGSLKTLLRKVCNDLKLGDRSCVLLALSAATDNMIRAMHMFPEVQFIDVAANMNKQKRDMLFFRG